MTEKDPSSLCRASPRQATPGEFNNLHQKRFLNPIYNFPQLRLTFLYPKEKFTHRISYRGTTSIIYGESKFINLPNEIYKLVLSQEYYFGGMIRASPVTTASPFWFSHIVSMRIRFFSSMSSSTFK